MIETLKEVRDALHKARRQITHADVAPHQCIPEAITKLDALIAQEKAEPVVQPLPGADWTITMRRMMNAGCSKRTCTCKPEDAKNCLWWDGMGDAPHQPAPSTSPLTDFDIAAAIEVADAKWADADVPLGWAKHFARALEAKIGAKP